MVYEDWYLHSAAWPKGDTRDPWGRVHVEFREAPWAAMCFLMLKVHRFQAQVAEYEYG